MPRYQLDSGFPRNYPRYFTHVIFSVGKPLPLLRSSLGSPDLARSRTAFFLAMVLYGNSSYLAIATDDLLDGSAVHVADWVGGIAGQSNRSSCTIHVAIV